MSEIIGIVGAGAMGSGIAQVAAQSGHSVIVYEKNADASKKSAESITKTLSRLVEKAKVSEDEKNNIISRISYAGDLQDLKSADLIIEAIIENIEVKKEVFRTLESFVSETCILATNTSSLSVASIGAACKHDHRVIGIHFFNPAPLMPLVEIIPSVATSEEITFKSRRLIDSWGKKTVLAKDTPGFIVNRVARPFYGEAIRLYEEGIADMATIDQAMKDKGFRMGPFELMDYIGNDINYTVTETVFREFYYDSRYRPSFTQKRMMESGRLGRKTGRGYYDYQEGAVQPQPSSDQGLKDRIAMRVLCMLINEAVDALYLNIASKEDLETAMTKGVNYPKGLLAWADEIGLENVLSQLETLQANYGEDRYRPSFLLRKMTSEGDSFFG